MTWGKGRGHITTHIRSEVSLPVTQRDRDVRESAVGFTTREPASVFHVNHHQNNKMGNESRFKAKTRRTVVARSNLNFDQQVMES